MTASAFRPSRPIAARSLPLLALLALLVACTPFQPGMPGGPAAADAGRTVLQAAESRIGAPYRYGGAGPDAFDCSGLPVPRTAAQQFASATPVARKDLRPGDLVFFRLDGRDVSHVGIYAGDDRFVHAPQSGGNVRMASLDDDWYRKRYAGAGRFHAAQP